MWRLLAEARGAGYSASFRLLWRVTLRCLDYVVVQVGTSIVSFAPSALPVPMVVPVVEQGEERLHGIPRGHPERLVPDVPRTAEEVVLWSQLISLDTQRTDPSV